MQVDEVIALAEDADRRHSLKSKFAQADAELDELRKRQLASLDLIHAIAATIPYDDEQDAAQTFVESGGFLREGILRPVLDWAALHARLEFQPELARRHRAKASHGAKYGNEIEALRAFFAEGRKEASNTARAIERYRLGVVNLSGGKIGERAPIGDPHLTAVAKVLATIADRELLYLAYVKLDDARYTVESGKPGNRRRRIVRAGETREEHEEVVGTALPSRSAWQVAQQVTAIEDPGPMPYASKLSAGKHVTAAMLVAEAIGALTHPRMPERLRDEAEHASIAKVVGKRIGRARKALRLGLQALVLDVSPKRIIPEPPTPTEKELVQQALKKGKEQVECCLGFILQGGLRLPCEAVFVSGPAGRHPSTAWALCGACDRPQVPKRKSAP